MYNKRLGVLLVMVMLAIGLTACGSKGTGNSETTEAKVAEATTVTEAVQEEVGEAVETEETGESEYTLEDYFNENPGDLEDMRKSVNEDESYSNILHIDMEVEGNTLSYIYTFKETYTEEQVASMKPGLEETLEKAAENSGEQIATMEEGFGVKGIKLYMEYRNGDGTVICSKTMG